jgi:hypothetical protein
MSDRWKDPRKLALIKEQAPVEGKSLQAHPGVNVEQTNLSDTCHVSDANRSSATWTPSSLHISLYSDLSMPQSGLSGCRLSKSSNWRSSLGFQMAVTVISCETQSAKALLRISFTEDVLVQNSLKARTAA